MSPVIINNNTIIDIIIDNIDIIFGEAICSTCESKQPMQSLNELLHPLHLDIIVTKTTVSCIDVSLFKYPMTLAIPR